MMEATTNVEQNTEIIDAVIELLNTGNFNALTAMIGNLEPAEIANLLESLPDSMRAITSKVQPVIATPFQALFLNR